MNDEMREEWFQPGRVAPPPQQPSYAALAEENERLREELAALRAVEATATNSIAQDINVFHLFRAANELYM